MAAPYEGDSASLGTPGLKGVNSAAGDGVFGDGGQAGRGVVGISGNHTGVEGFSESGVAVFGRSNSGEGVHGVSHSAGAAAEIGINDSTGPGVRGVSTGFDGVSGTSLSAQHVGVAATNDGGGMGLLSQGNPAARFVGNVEVTGDLFLVNGDCSEDFDISSEHVIEPGTVMVIADDGLLEPSCQAYDRRVAGVISGAGNYRSAITLDRRQSCDGRASLALVGKVYCKVDAQYAPIATGDLLTTSPTRGHAMRVGDATLGFGALIGKALQPYSDGQGLIPILVALQ